MTRKQAVIAGAFAVVYPGLGHVYLSEWIRAAAWFGGAVLLAAFLIPPSVVDAVETSGLTGLYEASQNLPLRTVIPLLLIRILNVIDAVWIGLQKGQPRQADPDESPATCPECGGDLDEDLEFCPWCTTVLSKPDNPEDQ